MLMKRMVVLLDYENKGKIIIHATQLQKAEAKLETADSLETANASDFVTRVNYSWSLPLCPCQHDVYEIIRCWDSAHFFKVINWHFQDQPNRRNQT